MQQAEQFEKAQRHEAPRKQRITSALDQAEAALEKQARQSAEFLAAAGAVELAPSSTELQDYLDTQADQIATLERLVQHQKDELASSRRAAEASRQCNHGLFSLNSSQEALIAELRVKEAQLQVANVKLQRDRDSLFASHQQRLEELQRWEKQAAFLEGRVLDFDKQNHDLLQANTKLHQQYTALSSSSTRFASLPYNNNN